MVRERFANHRLAVVDACLLNDHSDSLRACFCKVTSALSHFVYIASGIFGRPTFTTLAESFFLVICFFMVLTSRLSRREIWPGVVPSRYQREAKAIPSAFMWARCGGPVSSIPRERIPGAALKACVGRAMPSSWIDCLGQMMHEGEELKSTVSQKSRGHYNKRRLR